MNVTLKTGTHRITKQRWNADETQLYFKVEFDGFTAPMCRWMSLTSLMAEGNDGLDLIMGEPAITSVTIAMAPAAVKVAA